MEQLTREQLSSIFRDALAATPEAGKQLKPQTKSRYIKDGPPKNFYWLLANPELMHAILARIDAAVPTPVPPADVEINEVAV
jgi:hypothetical protein